MSHHSQPLSQKQRHNIPGEYHDKRPITIELTSVHENWKTKPYHTLVAIESVCAIALRGTSQQYSHLSELSVSLLTRDLPTHIERLQVDKVGIRVHLR